MLKNVVMGAFGVAIFLLCILGFLSFIEYGRNHVVVRCEEDELVVQVEANMEIIYQSISPPTWLHYRQHKIFIYEVMWVPTLSCIMLITRDVWDKKLGKIEYADPCKVFPDVTMEIMHINGTIQSHKLRMKNLPECGDVNSRSCNTRTAAIIDPRTNQQLRDLLYSDPRTLIRITFAPFLFVQFRLGFPVAGRTLRGTTLRWNSTKPLPGNLVTLSLTSVQDNTKHLREIIQTHVLVGIDHIFLAVFPHLLDQATAQLQDFLNEKKVSLIPLGIMPNSLVTPNNEDWHCLKYGMLHSTLMYSKMFAEFSGALDMDELIVLSETNATIGPILRKLTRLFADRMPTIGSMIPIYGKLGSKMGKHKDSAFLGEAFPVTGVGGSRYVYIKSFVLTQYVKFLGVHHAAGGNPVLPQELEDYKKDKSLWTLPSHADHQNTSLALRKEMYEASTPRISLIHFWGVYRDSIYFEKEEHEQSLYTSLWFPLVKRELERREREFGIKKVQ